MNRYIIAVIVGWLAGVSAGCSAGHLEPSGHAHRLEADSVWWFEDGKLFRRSYKDKSLEVVPCDDVRNPWYGEPKPEFYVPEPLESASQ